MAATNCCVSVATPDMRPMKLSKIRSQVSKCLVGPSMRAATTRNDSVLTDDHVRFAAGQMVDQRERRPIVCPIEVFAHRQANQLPAIVFDRVVPIELREIVGHGI